MVAEKLTQECGINATNLSGSSCEYGARRLRNSEPAPALYTHKISMMFFLEDIKDIARFLHACSTGSFIISIWILKANDRQRVTKEQHVSRWQHAQNKPAPVKIWTGLGLIFEIEQLQQGLCDLFTNALVRAVRTMHMLRYTLQAHNESNRHSRQGLEAEADTM